MSEAIDSLQRRKTQAIAAGFGISLIFGSMAVMQFPGMLDATTMQAAMDELRGSTFYFAYQVATLAVCFFWLTLDSRQLDIRRPWWLNVGVVFLTTIFVAYYLYKTRPVGRRGQAILALFGVVFGYVIATMAGVMMAAAMSGAPS